MVIAVLCCVPWRNYNKIANQSWIGFVLCFFNQVIMWFTKLKIILCNVLRKYVWHTRFKHLKSNTANKISVQKGFNCILIKKRETNKALTSSFEVTGENVHMIVICSFQRKTEEGAMCNSWLDVCAAEHWRQWCSSDQQDSLLFHHCTWLKSILVAKTNWD